VFIGCGGSSFSDILSHRITGANVQKYLWYARLFCQIPLLYFIFPYFRRKK
jgi:hypothetical protein